MDVLRRIHSLLQRDDVVILDTETTGTSQAEVIELAIIRADGVVLLDQLLKPRRMVMNPYAQRVHGISLDELADKPTLPDVLSELDRILDASVVLAWNAAFDCKMIQNSRAIWSMPGRKFAYHCAMRLYGQLHGRSSIGLHKAIVAAGLETVFSVHQSHRALGDTFLVLELLRAASREADGPSPVSQALP